MANVASRVIETNNMPLEEWLALLFNPPKNTMFTNYQFPTTGHRDTYLATIRQRPEEEILRLLSIFLVPSGSFGKDSFTVEWLMDLKQKEPAQFQQVMRRQHCQRVMAYCTEGRKDVLPWEGITWILDLLPGSPHQALQALAAYLMAHFPYLPDGRIVGLVEAEAIIRAKFIGVPGTHADTINLLLSEGPRTFECLIERLYHAMGYQTTLTSPQKDGGRDVIARKDRPGQLEHLLIECKLRTDPVGVETIRQLHSVVDHEKANKGVLVTNSRFTRGARKWADDEKLELIGGRELIPLMNEHLGTCWPTQIESLVRKATGVQQS